MSTVLRMREWQQTQRDLGQNEIPKRKEVVEHILASIHKISKSTVVNSFCCCGITLTMAVEHLELPVIEDVNYQDPYDEHEQSQTEEQEEPENHEGSDVVEPDGE